MWIKRRISDHIQRASASFPAVIITGARQVGKTSLLKKLYPDHSYVTLDLPSHAALAEQEPEEFLKRYKPPVIIDEVQYAPKLFRHLKVAIDQKRDFCGQFLLTGSQKFSLMKNVSDSLAGRAALIELETLSLGEIFSVRPLSIPLTLLEGGFPERHAKEGIDRKVFYQSYLATYLERDLRSMLNVGHLRDFERFLRGCALRSGQLLNKADLARDVGITPTTANEWISVLQASNQIVLLEPWFSNKTKSMIKSPKLYLSDTGLLCYLLNIETEEELMKSPLAGLLWETFVCSEIRKEQTFKRGKWDLWFWRDKYGLEADFLIDRGGRFSLFEAKFTEQAVAADAHNIAKIASLMGVDKIDKRCVISKTKASYPLKEGISCHPIQDIGSLV